MAHSTCTHRGTCLQELMHWLEDKHSSTGGRLHTLLCRCLEEGPWRLHCQRLLQLLPRQDLLPFAVDLLGSSAFPEGGSNGSGGGAAAAGDAAAAGPAAVRGAAVGAAAEPASPGAWLVFRHARWASLDQLLLASALGCSLPLLLRLLRDDELVDERRQVEQLVRKLLRLDPGQQPHQQAAAMAAHWSLRQQLAEQERAAQEVELHELLLLHLFAAAFLVQQLSCSGSESDARQLQQLLAASGFPCQLATAGEGASSRRSGSSKKHRKQKRRHSSKGGSGKKSKKKRRRRSHSEASDSRSSDSEDGGSSDEGSLLSWHGGGSMEGGQRGERQLWELQGPGSRGARSVSSFELLDAVIDAAAWAHARWLFGRR